MSELEDIPEGMVGMTVPGGSYALFTHKGMLDKLAETYDLIYSTWLPNPAMRRPGCSALSSTTIGSISSRTNLRWISTCR